MPVNSGNFDSKRASEAGKKSAEARRNKKKKRENPFKNLQCEFRKNKPDTHMLLKAALNGDFGEDIQEEYARKLLDESVKQTCRQDLNVLQELLRRASNEQVASVAGLRD